MSRQFWCEPMYPPPSNFNIFQPIHALRQDLFPSITGHLSPKPIKDWSKMRRILRPTRLETTHKATQDDGDAGDQGAPPAGRSCAGGRAGRSGPVGAAHGDAAGPRDAPSQLDRDRRAVLGGPLLVAGLLHGRVLGARRDAVRARSALRAPRQPHLCQPLHRELLARRALRQLHRDLPQSVSRRESELRTRQDVDPRHAALDGARWLLLHARHVARVEVAHDPVPVHVVLGRDRAGGRHLPRASPARALWRRVSLVHALLPLALHRIKLTTCSRGRRRSTDPPIPEKRSNVSSRYWRQALECVQHNF